MSLSSTFPVSTIAGLNPERVDAERDSDLSTAQTWTLHLRISSAVSVHECAERIMTLSDGMVFDYAGGDSFAEWAERYDELAAVSTDQPGRALHLYFEATDLTDATLIARTLGALSNDLPTHLRALNATLSAAGDWAEQAEVWSN